MNFWRISLSSVGSIGRGLKHKVWGFSPRWEGICKQIRKGDRVVIYASETHSFTAICEVTKEHYVDSSPIWLDDIYPHRIGIEPLLVPEKPLELKQARELANRPKLGGAFISAIANLPSEDFEVILKMITSPRSNPD